MSRCEGAVKDEACSSFLKKVKLTLEMMIHYLRIFKDFFFEQGNNMIGLRLG